MIFMKRIILILRNAFVIIYLIAVHIFAGLFIYENIFSKYTNKDSAQNVNIPDPTEIRSVPTPAPVPSIFPDETPTPEQTFNQSAQNENVAPPQISGSVSDKIMIPVAGIKRGQITDTFNDARSNGRVHNANDIMAANGTPVVAAVTGEIAKFFDSERGGITIYQYSPDRRMVYYYAHLQRRADNLREHDTVKQGTVIGYVGDTGNAGAGNNHLHFAITVLDDPKNVFKGTEINPFPLLKDGIEAQ